jgi:hypothetical protein
VLEAGHIHSHFEAPAAQRGGVGHDRIRRPARRPEREC